ncbi:MAG: AI-2E family transporter [Candidatus Nanopelagicales bacterium]
MTSQPSPSHQTAAEPHEPPTAAPETSLAEPTEQVSAAVDAGAREVTVSFDSKSVGRSAIRVLLLVAVFLLGLWLYSVTSHFLFLLMLAWLFAIALEPGIRWFIRRGRSRGTGALIMGGGAILVGLALAATFGELFFTQIAQFVQSVPSLTASIIDWINGTFDTSFNASQIASSLSLSPSQMASYAASLSGGVFGVIESLSAVTFDLVTVLVFGFYFASDSPNFFRTIASWMPQRSQLVFLNVTEIAIAKTGGYVASKIILAALSSFFHGILFLAIGVPYWLPFALFVGITAQFVPLVGTYIGIALPVLATVFDAPWKAVVIIVFAAIYQQIETYVFTPRVSRKTMDVNQAIALGAVFVGAAIWGPLGALIGIPIAAAGVAILQTYQTRYDLAPEVADAPDLSGGKSVTA